MEYKYVARVPMSSSCSHMVHCQTETTDQWSLSYNKTLRRITPPELPSNSDKLAKLKYHTI